MCMEEYIEKTSRILKLMDISYKIRYLSSAPATITGRQHLVTFAAPSATIGSHVPPLLLTQTSYTSAQRTCTHRRVTVVATVSQFGVSPIDPLAPKKQKTSKTIRSML